MRHVVEAGTDAALLAVFDPTALPEDLEKKFQHDTLEYPSVVAALKRVS